MTNEKDPHNLMLAFSIVKVILVEFDIVGLQEVPFLDRTAVEIRNSSMQCSAIFRSLSRHGLMMYTELLLMT
jgi:Dos2-interacting transcription regulator of RNA-Pol-II